jgi:hypothetical protein
MPSDLVKRLSEWLEAAPPEVNQLEEAIAALEEIVCVKAPDCGVILLSHESPTHYDPMAGVQVYDHKNFSPLGDALVALHNKLTKAAAALSREGLTLAAITKTARLIGGRGLRKFATSIGLLPSRLSEIESSGIATAEEWKAIHAGLDALRPSHAIAVSPSLPDGEGDDKSGLESPEILLTDDGLKGLMHGEPVACLTPQGRIKIVPPAEPAPSSVEGEREWPDEPSSNNIIWRREGNLYRVLRVAGGAGAGEARFVVDTGSIGIVTHTYKAMRGRWQRYDLDELCRVSLSSDAELRAENERLKRHVAAAERHCAFMDSEALKEQKASYELQQQLAAKDAEIERLHLEAKESCPCAWGNPCHDRCPCVNSLSSASCTRCCRYGSEEQQREAARILIAQEAEVAQLRSARDNWRVMYRDLYCAIWLATEEEFQEAEASGLDHQGTQNEAARDWRARTECESLRSALSKRDERWEKLQLQIVALKNEADRDAEKADAPSHEATQRRAKAFAFDVCLDLMRSLASVPTEGESVAEKPAQSPTFTLLEDQAKVLNSILGRLNKHILRTKVGLTATDMDTAFELACELSDWLKANVYEKFAEAYQGEGRA